VSASGCILSCLSNFTAFVTFWGKMCALNIVQLNKSVFCSFEGLLFIQQLQNFVWISSNNTIRKGVAFTIKFTAPCFCFLKCNPVTVKASKKTSQMPYNCKNSCFKPVFQWSCFYVGHEPWHQLISIHKSNKAWLCPVRNSSCTLLHCSFSVI